MVYNKQVPAGVMELGSDGSAACGGYSDLSEWQRSARDAGVHAKDIRRAPQQGTYNNACGVVLLNGTLAFNSRLRLFVL